MTTEISREDLQQALDIFKKNHIETGYNQPDSVILQVLEDRLNQPDKVNQAYSERNKVVATLAKCFPSGIRKTTIEGWDEKWHGCVYIDLPTGQASWHYHDDDAYMFADLLPYTKEWDGHTTDEKYARMLNMLVQPDWESIAEEMYEFLSKQLDCSMSLESATTLSNLMSKYESMKGEK